MISREKKNEYQRKYRKNHPEKRREYEFRYRVKYPEKKAAKYKRSYLKHREDRLKKSRKYVASHRFEAIKRTNNWRLQNPGRAMINGANSRSKKLGAIGSHTFEEWELLKKQYGHRCPGCGKSEPEIKLQQDHVIPISKGGSNYIENIQPLCGKCNQSKKDKMPDEISIE